MKKLFDFIKLYHLNGIIESVAWKLGEFLEVKFISVDKTVVGIISMKNEIKGLQESGLEIGIMDTTGFLNFLKITEDFELNLNKLDVGDEIKVPSIQLKNLKDGGIANCMLADLSTINRPKEQKLNEIPDSDLRFTISGDVYKEFCGARKFLSHIRTFAILKDKTGEHKLSIGHSTINANNYYGKLSNIEKLTDEPETMNPMFFDLKALEEILSIHEKNNPVFELSVAGILKIFVKNDDYSATYYLTEVESDI